MNALILYRYVQEQYSIVQYTIQYTYIFLHRTFCGHLKNALKIWFRSVFTLLFIRICKQTTTSSCSPLFTSPPPQKRSPGSGLTNQPCKFSGQYQQFRTCGQLEIPKDFFPVSAGLSMECPCTSFFAEAYPYNTVQRHKWKQGRKSASHSTPFVASGLTRLTHHGYNRARFPFTVLEPDLPLSI